MTAEKNKRMRSMTVVTAGVCIFALIMLGIFALFLYYLTEQTYDAHFVEKSLGYADDVSNRLLLGKGYLDGSDQPPGYGEYRVLSAIRATNYRSLSGERFSTKTAQENEKAAPVQTAVIVQDAQGNTLLQSGNYLFFSYRTEETWKERQEAGADGYGWIELGTDAQASALYRGMERLNTAGGVSCLRITGSWDGTGLVPRSIDYVTYKTTLAARESYERESGTRVGRNAVRELDNAGLLEWQSAFASAEGAAPNGLVTVYTDDFEFSFYDPGGAVRCKDTAYDHLLAWAGSGKYQDGVVREDSGIFVLKRRPVLAAEGDSGEEYTIITAVWGDPQRNIISAGPIVTFLLMALLTAGFVILLLWIMKRNLVEPVKIINAGISDDWDTVWFADELSPRWRELHELHRHYEETRDELLLQKDEITRLNTALNYAKSAEQNRRQMMSGIAHELKTPLAVIHSYTEGLKENIAQSKREKYLDVILAETERLDGMVLELLDLSRLEAGRVKLSRSAFSLSGLARSVFERLEMAIGAKGLRVEYCFPDDCTVTADEARIRQVVENLATNAVKYTPANGSVRVGIGINRFETTFWVENDSAPLSDEALRKVWDTFYRAEEARSGEGTGLGLAVAKSIVELHGGKCSVQNTGSGVRFQFTI